jgi:hypothetical protein
MSAFIFFLFLFDHWLVQLLLLLFSAIVPVAVQIALWIGLTSTQSQYDM